MRKMSKEMKQEMTWLLPTPKRLKFIEENTLSILEQSCHLNNECYELMDRVREDITNKANVLYLTLLSDNIDYLKKYVSKISKFHDELKESLEELEKLENKGFIMFKTPWFLVGRIRKTLSCEVLTRETHNEILYMFKETNKDYVDLLTDIKDSRLKEMEGELTRQKNEKL